VTTTVGTSTAEAFCDDFAARRWWRRNGDGVRIPVSLGIDEIQRRYLPGSVIDASPEGQRIVFRDGSVAHEARRGRWEVAR
jgi:hypothetical protein